MSRILGQPMSDRAKPFKERLNAFAENQRKRAKFLPPGEDRDLALQKIRQAETASNLDEWADPRGLQPRK